LKESAAEEDKELPIQRASVIEFEESEMTGTNMEQIGAL